jgi:catechol 2,3-dioxygenase-like lactoylglutathione lyase family enzyme
MRASAQRQILLAITQRGYVLGAIVEVQVRHAQKGGFMLGTAKVITPIAVNNLQRAKDFYTRVLGLREANVAHEDGEVVLEAGAHSAIALRESPDAGTSEHAVAAFEVGDVEVEVEQLRDNGVAFLDYDLPGLRTDDGVVHDDVGACAWFEDPSGNILAITDHPA